MKFKSQLLIITSLLFFSVACFAQSSWRVGLGLNPGVATSKAFRYTLGADIRVQKNFNDRIAGTLTAGFTHFFEKDHFANYSQYGSPYNVIPVKAGIKYFVGNQLYLGGEAGAGIAFEQWGTSFLWSPSVGMAFRNGWDVSLKYEDYTKSPVTKDVALRLAYGFGPRKLATHKRNSTNSGWHLGVALTPGLTTTAFEDFVLGGEVSVNKNLTSNLEAFVSGGYTHYFKGYTGYRVIQSSGEWVVDITGERKGFIPVKTGLRLYAGNQFYVSGEAGAAFAMNGRINFVYAPSAGLALNNGLDVGIRYDRYSEGNMPNVMSLKLGYRFKL
ncbi:hypothetical protein KHS38_19905 [Mucilaginibacter sp. Bleaf8]|uniref:hypothetical protein n=1 Tax=Mucilaginibacter sp. Bleaf8 TaxID=2834430 RepID=UPI001BD137DA|nr:hypothetical protein [Mucilaginibacter sp. Bleaf8]MBS7566679.1 hypothetical protein [Mucilaginibacter sp. Bleaf8]